MMSEIVSSRGRDEGRRRKKASQQQSAKPGREKSPCKHTYRLRIFLSVKLYFASNTYTHS